MSSGPHQHLPFSRARRELEANDVLDLPNPLPAL
jgi:hypothetical protein